MNFKNRDDKFNNIDSEYMYLLNLVGLQRREVLRFIDEGYFSDDVNEIRNFILKSIKKLETILNVLIDSGLTIEELEKIIGEKISKNELDNVLYKFNRTNFYKENKEIRDKIIKKCGDDVRLGVLADIFDISLRKINIILSKRK